MTILEYQFEPDNGVIRMTPLSSCALVLGTPVPVALANLMTFKGKLGPPPVPGVWHKTCTGEGRCLKREWPWDSTGSTMLYIEG